MFKGINQLLLLSGPWGKGSGLTEVLQQLDVHANRTCEGS